MSLASEVPRENSKTSYEQNFIIDTSDKVVAETSNSTCNVSECVHMYPDATTQVTLTTTQNTTDNLNSFYFYEVRNIIFVYA